MNKLSFNKLFNKNDEDKSEYLDSLWTTPWQTRDVEDVYIGNNNSVWLYRSLPLTPLQWEDDNAKMGICGELATLLDEIGSLSVAPISGIKSLGYNREIHLISVNWEEDFSPDKESSVKLSNFISETLEGFTTPKRALFIGVRLRHSGKNNKEKVIDKAKSVVTKLLLEDVTDRSLYNEDVSLVNSIISRYGGKKLTRDERMQLESWYNMGRGPDVTIVENVTSIDVSDYDTFEFSAVMNFGQPILYPPNSRWILDALTHIDAPKVVSVRAELEPATVTRNRARKSQRRVSSAIQEESLTGDLEKVELTDTFQMAQEFERYMVDVGDPILTKCSILLVRSVKPTNETYLDFLRNNYDIQIKPLEHRQIRALDETLPASSRRVNPFLQDITIAMLAYSGLNGFSNIGDKKGVFIGVADPDITPVFLDIKGAPNRNLPPAMLVAGDPGSGKTFLCQSIALQATLEGHPVIFINPKGFDSLKPLADLTNGQVVKMSALAVKPGAFDPFRYAPPQIAAEIATTHILSVLGNREGFTQAQELLVGQAMRDGARSGARCVGDALKYITDETVVTQIRQQVDGSSLFALGIALEPWPEFSATGGLTLVEFDRKLDLPDPSKDSSNYSRAENISLAAVRLVARASLEILMKSGGGVLIVDEAWTFLGFPEGLAAMQSLGREGRSLNILPVFATQRIADVISRDMEGYLSRVFCLKLSDPREAKAALELCKLEPNESRIKWLSNCGPVSSDGDNPGRPPRALHRDLDNRHSAVILGPTSQWVYDALTTNPLERKLRDEKVNSKNDPSN
ncbi:MAG: hypothetical protein RL348_821 [Bacteroidota bacterium]